MALRKRASRPGLAAEMLARLVAARRAHGWSQRELASKVGLPQVHISAIETGKVTPRFDTLLGLVRVLGFDLMLIPRPLVPMVQSLVRDSQHSGGGKADEAERPLYGADEVEETP
jgi:transcriptional regulator with XRE-family HTH domain